MSNWKLINQESNQVAALVVLCQDYVLADEEFMSNHKIQKNMNNSEFWIELAEGLRGAVSTHLQGSVENGDCYDEYESYDVSDNVILDFIMSPTNRFELNDIICETIENWLNHFGGKRFK